MLPSPSLNIKPPRRLPIAEKVKIPWAKDFLDALRHLGRARYVSASSTISVARAVEPCFENPCVGGSIPPRGTKNIAHATPTHASGRFCFLLSESSCPVHLRLSAFCWERLDVQDSVHSGQRRRWCGWRRYRHWRGKPYSDDMFRRIRSGFRPIFS